MALDWIPGLHQSKSGLLNTFWDKDAINIYKGIHIGASH